MAQRVGLGALSGVDRWAFHEHAVYAKSMKFGLRLQILVLLGGLMGLAFLPLYYAISTYTTVALSRALQDNSRVLGQAVAAHVAEARESRGSEAVRELMQRQAVEKIAAIGAYDADGNLELTAGDSAQWLPQTAYDAKTAGVLTEDRNLLLTVVQQGETGFVAVISKIQGQAASVLNRLLALYMALIAMALLVAAYFTLTYWIVRPLDQVAAAARRVASPVRGIELGAERSLEMPPARSRELQELSESIDRMTASLFKEEKALRRKVEEVEKATDQLTQAQAQLVRSERLASVGQLAAGLAHEVGNPIAAMQGLQDLLLETELDPATQQDFVRRMRKETERISRILRDLLQFARPSSDADEREPGAVEAAIHETITLLAPQPLLRDVDLELDVYPDLPSVTLPHEQLMQVLLNLVMNSAAACKDGRILVRARRLEFEHLPMVELVVEDDGPGVTAELADTLFEPFVSTKDVGEGTGLGLSVCKGLIEASGGSIRLDKDFKSGARFVVTLAVTTN